MRARHSKNNIFGTVCGVYEITGTVPPRQQRSKELVEKIKLAFTELLEDGHYYAAIRNVEIANKAGIHVQSIFQWFEQGKATISYVVAMEKMHLLADAMRQEKPKPDTLEVLTRHWLDTAIMFFQADTLARRLFFDLDIPPRMSQMYEWDSRLVWTSMWATETDRGRWQWWLGHKKLLGYALVGILESFLTTVFSPHVMHSDPVEVDPFLFAAYHRAIMAVLTP